MHVSPDGQQLIYRPTNDDMRGDNSVVLNWTSLLNRP
jgi:hypothetical protein